MWRGFQASMGPMSRSGSRGSTTTATMRNLVVATTSSCTIRLANRRSRGLADSRPVVATPTAAAVVHRTSAATGTLRAQVHAPTRQVRTRATSVVIPRSPAVGSSRRAVTARAATAATAATTGQAP